MADDKKTFRWNGPPGVLEIFADNGNALFSGTVSPGMAVAALLPADHPRIATLIRRGLLTEIASAPVAEVKSKKSEGN